MTTVGVLTDGETPSLVCIRPCTIHGCRPFSVSSQPAVFMTNGSDDRPDRQPQEPAGASRAVCAGSSQQPPQREQEDAAPPV